MLNRIRRFIRRFLNKSQSINDEPLNKVSLIVIILIDIFILFNVFVGLDDISRWHVSPSEAYPCYSEWQNYQLETSQGKNFDITRQTLSSTLNRQTSLRDTYQQTETDRLGEVSKTCLQYFSDQDQINNSENQGIIQSIDQKLSEISTLEQANQTIRDQYDSTLLEQIAGQPPEQSINSVSAARARQELDQNNAKINTLKQEITTLKEALLGKPETQSFISYLNNPQRFSEVEQGYKHASFWYPTIQLGFQALFLLPLIFVALSVHNFSQRKGYGLVSLISWHLLVIFLIPLILKVFEFLQVGAIVQVVVDFLSTLLRGLVFLISYLYILLIPLIGFGIIKFFQRVVFNSKAQAAKRIQKSCCIKCAKKLHALDTHCPHCGYFQYTECHNCHTLTYKYLPYCKACGSAQERRGTQQAPG
jgi:hypothetical protein